MNDDEFARQVRVTDQMISMYSVLRDRYDLRAKLVASVLFGLSIFLSGLVVPPHFLRIVLGIAQTTEEGLITVVTISLLLASAVEFLVDWKGRSYTYAFAGQKLSTLKARQRAALAEGEAGDTGRIEALMSDYSCVCEGLPPIPDEHFAPLKASHLRKVRLSRRLDDTPHCPIILLKAIMACEDLWAALHHERTS
jgi:hypothetical protein